LSRTHGAATITLVPIGYVRSTRPDVRDDHWDQETSSIELAPQIPAAALDGLEAFSHAEILFHFDRVDESQVAYGARHPRGNRDWPEVGVFAQRTKYRPNRLGTTIVAILGREGRRLRVTGLDAIDGTPVIDIKPVMLEFLPRTPVRQPAWSHQLMREYWTRS
jgi:tRNA-Thr(GGU) m(6)t(6)A37 methyltransferase TsaA